MIVHSILVWRSLEKTLPRFAALASGVHPRPAPSCPLVPRLSPELLWRLPGLDRHRLIRVLRRPTAAAAGRRLGQVMPA